LSKVINESEVFLKIPTFQVQQADGRWVLIGIVSAGFSCGKPGQPGIYHRISSTSDWISYYTNNRDNRFKR